MSAAATNGSSVDQEWITRPASQLTGPIESRETVVRSKAWAIVDEYEEQFFVGRSDADGRDHFGYLSKAVLFSTREIAVKALSLIVPPNDSERSNYGVVKVTADITSKR